MLAIAGANISARNHGESVGTVRISTMLTAHRGSQSQFFRIMPISRPYPPA